VQQLSIDIEAEKIQMKIFERRTPDSIMQNWKLKDVSYNSSNRLILIFNKGRDSDQEFLVCLDEEETKKLIKFVGNIIN